MSQLPLPFGDFIERPEQTRGQASPPAQVVITLALDWPGGSSGVLRWAEPGTISRDRLIAEVTRAVEGLLDRRDK